MKKLNKCQWCGKIWNIKQGHYFVFWDNKPSCTGAFACLSRAKKRRKKKAAQ